MALFDAAARFVDRLPQAGPGEFLEHLRGQEVPGDTLVERAPSDDAVALLTPQGAAGREWRIVVVSGVQVGVWPDTRLRGSLLGSQALVDVLAGRGDGSPEALRSAQAAVRHEEMRLFHVAVSRAREQLHVTAVAGDDEQPSGLVDLVSPLDVSPLDAAAPDGSAGHDDERVHTRLPRALSLPAVVARLRQVVTAQEPDSDAAVAGLARLAREGVPGAAPGRVVRPGAGLRRRAPGPGRRPGPRLAVPGRELRGVWAALGLGGRRRQGPGPARPERRHPGPRHRQGPARGRRGPAARPSSRPAGPGWAWPAAG